MRFSPRAIRFGPALRWVCGVLPKGSEVRIGTAIAAVARPLTGTSAVWSLTTVGNTSTFTESTGVLADSTAAGNICN
jgi:hypothetical protein